jgi:hypothetical protein
VCVVQAENGGGESSGSSGTIEELGHTIHSEAASARRPLLQGGAPAVVPEAVAEAETGTDQELEVRLN